MLHKGPVLENVIEKTEREKAQRPAEFEPMTTCLRILRLSIGCITAVRSPAYQSGDRRFECFWGLGFFLLLSYQHLKKLTFSILYQVTQGVALKKATYPFDSKWIHRDKERLGHSTAELQLLLKITLGG